MSNCKSIPKNPVIFSAKGPRISKAQKRRDKKAEKEKQHLLDKERQELENLTGKRNVEQETISRLLEGRGLSLFEVPSDGDCMFAGERNGFKKGNSKLELGTICFIIV